MNINYSKVVEFWKWFKSIANELISNPNNSDLLNKLDEFVLSIGPFDWEIGPMDKSLKFLAISPNLNEDFLSITRQIISLAPECEGWIFLPAKPAKGLQEVFKMYNESGKLITVDTSQWQYVLYKFDDGTFDMDIKGCEIEGNLDYSYLAVDIGLTNLLGEEKYMKLIKNIKIVKKFQDTDKNKATPFKYLDKHLGNVSK